MMSPNATFNVYWGVFGSNDLQFVHISSGVCILVGNAKPHFIFPPEHFISPECQLYSMCFEDTLKVFVAAEISNGRNNPYIAPGVEYMQLCMQDYLRTVSYIDAIKYLRELEQKGMYSQLLRMNDLYHHYCQLEARANLKKQNISNITKKFKEALSTPHHPTCRKRLLFENSTLVTETY